MLTDLSECCVPRLLKLQIYLKDDVRKTTDNAITFAITGLQANQVKSYIPAKENICKFKIDTNGNSRFKVIRDFAVSGYNAELRAEKMAGISGNQVNQMAIGSSVSEKIQEVNSGC